MSEAAFTDSTTPRLENWRTVAPFSVSSTKTTSPSCSCAKCVMPIVATSPSARTHSCFFEYFRVAGAVLQPASHTTVSLCEPPVREGSLRGPSVKRRFDYRSGNVLAANTDTERRSDLRKRRGDVGEGDVLFYRRPVGPACDLADDHPVVRDLVAVPSHPTFDDETGDLPLRPFGFFRGDHVAPDELLVELAGPDEARLDRVGGLVDVVPIQGEARLQAQGVARAEADRLDSVRFSGREQRVPDPGRVGVRDEHLEAVLAGVPRSGERRADARDAAVCHAEGLERLHVGVGLPHEDVRGSRPLDRDECRGVRTIVERDVVAEMRQNVR